MESVGAWAVVDRVVPTWTQGVEEPTRITYDVGLGRLFHASELTPDARAGPESAGGAWRVARASNKWRPAEEAAQHPFPGTHPVVFTDAQDWGGWRAPRAEYDRDPERIEAQARLIANAPRLHALALELITLAGKGAATPEALRALARRAAAIELDLRDMPAPPAPFASADASAAAQPTAPPAAGMASVSLSERMAALERELNRRPMTAAGSPPAPPRAEREFYASPPQATFVRGRPR